MKTNKHKTLLLARKTQPLHARHLGLHFDYAPGTARSYLSRLGRQGLLERTRGGYGLTKKGHDRIHYFDVFGWAIFSGIDWGLEKLLWETEIPFQQRAECVKAMFDLFSRFCK